MSYTILGNPFSKKIGKKSRIFVWCKCKCGRKKQIRLDNLKNNKNAQCINCRGRKYIGKISGHVFSHIKSSAKKRNIEFNITKEYIWDLYVKQNGKCKLTGWNIDFADTKHEQKHGVTTASLDRIDSSKGYVIGNLQWLHKDVNRMKQIFGQEYIIEIARAITENHKNEEVFNTNRTGSELLYQINVGPCVSEFGSQRCVLG